MFKIAVQSGGMEEIYGIDGTYRLIRETGFDGVDANLDHLFWPKEVRNQIMPAAFREDLSEKEMLAYFRPWGDAAKKYGLDNYQAHAPFPSFVGGADPAYNAWLIEMLKKTIIGCASIECFNLIIHPFFHGYDTFLTKKEEWDLNIESYGKLAETAKREGVVINLENMFTHRDGKLYAAICNDPEEAVRYVDALNEAAGAKVFGFCLDTGHALLASLHIRRFMQALGGRITCFHVHDNDGNDDLHLAPYMGRLDWNSFIDGLRDIGFDRTLSFETFNVWNRVDPEIAPYYLKAIERTGRMFAERAAVRQ